MLPEANWVEFVENERTVTKPSWPFKLLNFFCETLYILMSWIYLQPTATNFPFGDMLHIYENWESYPCTDTVL